MSTIASLCSVGCLAKVFQVTKGRVHQLARRGIVKRVSRGRYDLLTSVEGYVAYLHAQPHPHPYPACSTPSVHALSRLVRHMVDILRSDAVWSIC